MPDPGPERSPASTGAAPGASLWKVLRSPAHPFSLPSLVLVVVLSAAMAGLGAGIVAWTHPPPPSTGGQVVVVWYCGNEIGHFAVAYIGEPSGWLQVSYGPTLLCPEGPESLPPGSEYPGHHFLVLTNTMSAGTGVVNSIELNQSYRLVSTTPSLPLSIPPRGSTQLNMTIDVPLEPGSYAFPGGTVVAN
ncbi:MAG: hypothetical protein KGI89_06115 [Euryarchaeota archaeon]|nr:hypothetical protein [Euryarchaeota archaeon]